MSEQDVFDRLKYRIEISKYGTRRYYNAAGQLHRTDGPAVEYHTGQVYWYLHGSLHRTDGPAIIYRSGGGAWFINGEELTEEEFIKAVTAL